MLKTILQKKFVKIIRKTISHFINMWIHIKINVFTNFAILQILQFVHVSSRKQFNLIKTIVYISWEKPFVCLCIFKTELRTKHVCRTYLAYIHMCYYKSRDCQDYTITYHYCWNLQIITAEQYLSSFGNRVNILHFIVISPSASCLIRVHGVFFSICCADIVKKMLCCSIKSICSCNICRLMF